MASVEKVFAYIHQEIVPLSQAFLHVSDLAVQRGYGIFDFFNVQGKQPLFLDAYLDRFYESAELMLLPVPLTRPELRSKVMELISINNMALSGVKLLLTGGYSSTGYHPGEPNLIITQQPAVPPAQAHVEKGIKIITHQFQRELPAAKTINYSMGIRLIGQISATGAEDVLYHQNGVVTEFPRCNFFIVKHDNTVVTPAQNVLAGITRKNVLQLAGTTYPTEEGEITLQDIYEAKEAFLTSTTKRILPIVQVNDKVIGDGKPGAVTKTLLDELLRLEQTYLAQSER